MQTILGANGVIGRELSPHLLGYTDRVRQVSRAPVSVHPTDELVRADLLDAEVKRGELRGMIVRSADFYGRGAVLSLTHATVTDSNAHSRSPRRRTAKVSPRRWRVELIPSV
jgi:uncharacterized protein YbjT (DUF2867 family)